MIRTSLAELNLALTLPSGQAFRWRKRLKQEVDGSPVWFGVIGRHAIELQQDPATGFVNYKFLNDDGKSKVKKMKTSTHEDLLRDYFQLDTSLEKLYKDWAEKDEFFKRVAIKFNGVRVLRQDPVENLFSFICSSNNNIKRITSMIENLCKFYGEPIYDDHEFGQVSSFPTIKSLTDPSVEAKLRELGFGYRAKFINQTAKQLHLLNQEHNCDNYLLKLRELEYEQVNQELIKLSGVGSKVADCIALFSLDKANSVPVDTHVYQIAARNYLKKLDLKKKSLSKDSYNQIANYFRDKFGDRAGWAHSVLFAADLKFLNLDNNLKTEPAASL